MDRELELKRITDEDGDSITVSLLGSGIKVRAWPKVEGSGVDFVFLTPKQSRKLRKALKRAEAAPPVA